MGAVADWRRVRRLGRYLVRDRRRLLVALLLLLPLALPEHCSLFFWGRPSASCAESPVFPSFRG